MAGSDGVNFTKGKKASSFKLSYNLNLLRRHRCTHEFQELLLPISLEIIGTRVILWVPMAHTILLLALTLNRCKCELFCATIVRAEFLWHFKCSYWTGSLQFYVRALGSSILDCSRVLPTFVIDIKQPLLVSALTTAIVLNKKCSGLFRHFINGRHPLL